MAVGKQPLDFVSYSGPDPEMHLDADSFEKLETALGRRLGAEVRETLQVKCNEYLFARRSEITRQTWQDVESRIAPYRSAAKAMWTLAYEHETRSDASFQLETIMETVFSQQPMRINAESDLLHIKPDDSQPGIVPFSENYELPDGAYFVALSDGLIQQIAMCLKTSVNLAEKALEERAKEGAEGSRPIAALELLILSLSTWAKQHYLPSSPYSTSAGYEPGAFALFMVELLAMIPEQYRETKHSDPGGMAEKIKRVRASHKKRALEQNGSMEK